MCVCARYSKRSQRFICKGSLSFRLCADIEMEEEMKTPEKLAEDYAFWQPYTTGDAYGADSGHDGAQLEQAYLAGWKAAMENYKTELSELILEDEEKK